MPHKPKAAKKHYCPPTLRRLEPQAALAELKAKGDLNDANVQKMLPHLLAASPTER